MDVIFWLIVGFVILCAAVWILDKILWIVCTPRPPKNKRIVPAFIPPYFEDQTQRWTPYRHRKVREDKAAWMDSFSS